MVISDKPSDVIIAPNLGSCLGISAYDKKKKIGGRIHCLLPLSNANPDKAKTEPYTYVDTGVVLLLNDLLSRGCAKSDLVIVVAGGSNINDENNVFEIGKKNYTILRKVLWKNNLLIKAEHIGDKISRTVSLHIESGEVWLRTQGQESKLAEAN